MKKQELSKRLSSVIEHATSPTMNRLIPKMKELFAAIRTEINAIEGTPGWRDSVASSVGAGICEFAEQLAAELKV